MPMVPLDKIKPNPFRNLDVYPLDAAKIEKLKSSIGRTGFWDNVVARQVNDHYELAYGHHRTEAARAVLGEKAQVDLIVKDLDNDTMLRIMAGDNDDVYAVKPGFILETVQTAKVLELKKHRPGNGPVPGEKRLANRISTFLDWPVHRVQAALAELTMIDNKELSHQAVIKLPRMEVAETFHREVKKAQRRNRPISLQRQETLAEKIATDNQEATAGVVRNAVFEEAYPIKNKLDKNKRDFTEYIIETAELANKLAGRLDAIYKYKSDLDSEVYSKTIEKYYLAIKCSKLCEKSHAIFKNGGNYSYEKKQISG